MVSGSLILIIGTLVHFVLGRWVDSPWALPDLTLLGICLALSQSPDSVMDLVLLSGLLPMLIAGRRGWDAGLAYAGAAALWHGIGSRWDLTNRRLSLGSVALVELGLSIWWLCRANTWSANMWGAIPLRVASTVAGWAGVGGVARRHLSRYV